MIGVAIAFYVVVVICFSILSFFALYQLWQFGYEGDASQRAGIMYLAVSLAALIVSLVAFLVLVR